MKGKIRSPFANPMASGKKGASDSSIKVNYEMKSSAPAPKKGGKIVTPFQNPMKK